MIWLHDCFYRYPEPKAMTDGLGDFPQIQRAVRGTKFAGNDYHIGWGEIPYAGCRQGVIESGFFYKGYHFDTLGIYQYSSLNTPQGNKEIADFDAPAEARDIISSQTIKSKYHQSPNTDYDDFKGIVLALQNPTDRSIRSISSPEKYYEFVENACAYYGSQLFLKLHPWNRNEIEQRFRNIAIKYGCAIDHTDHGVIENCEFVLVFNSTFTVDCMLRGVPVAMFVPGYFYQNPAVKYTAYRFPKSVGTDIEFGFKTCDFLIWQYCFNVQMPTGKWVQMFEHFADSPDMFPMREEFCYANNLP